MATRVMPVAPFFPDGSGHVYPEISDVEHANDLYPTEVLVFEDDAAKNGATFEVRVPDDYVGSPVLMVLWSANATTGDVVWDVDYTAIADAESVDPSTDDENATATESTDATALDLNTSEVSLTAGNFAAGDLVRGKLSRDGANASDTLAADARVHGVFFKYSDS